MSSGDLASLADYGWDDFFDESFRAKHLPGERPARVVWTASGVCRVQTEEGTSNATVAGKVRRAATGASDLPAVGDWVSVRPSDPGEVRIERVLARRSHLSRKVSGRRSDEQIVAANVDLVIVVMGLDGDYSLRRMERFLTTVWESNARPLALLNKIDLCQDPGAMLEEVERVAPGVPVLSACCKNGDGVEEVRKRIRPRETAVLIGSSGVGKSTLINRLMGDEVQRTREVRQGDDTGKHVTTHRELFPLPGGGLLIDSPGIRELQPWSGEESLSRAFDDITSLAGDCRFRDCSHETETGCTVRQAVEEGSLEPSRLENYRLLQKEVRYLELRQNESAQRIQKKKWREIHREMRRSNKHRK